MGFFGRKTIKAGPFRFTMSRSGISESVGTKRIRIGTNSKGRKRASINFGNGFRWTKSGR